MESSRERKKGEEGKEKHDDDDVAKLSKIGMKITPRDKQRLEWVYQTGERVGTIRWLSCFRGCSPYQPGE